MMMEKLEKHIKQKLQGRELTPSKEAWQKIEAGLGQYPKNKSKGKPIIWYAIAAIFIGLVVSTLFYFNSGNEQSTIPIVNEVVTTDNDLNEDEKEVEVVSNQESVSSNNTKNDIDGVFLATDSESTEIVQEIKLAEKEPLKDGFKNPQQLLIEQKIDEVFAHVRLLESQNEAVTDAEVDSLLRTAQREVMADKLFESDGSVDAMALLNEVEDELDKSFRDDIFDALKEGYTKLKTAVADRNN